MPWTEKQKRYLLSKVSPLKPSQKEKMKAELHSGFQSVVRAKKGKR